MANPPSPKFGNGAANASHGLASTNSGVACFTPGIRIVTARGHVPVENVRVGDLLQTADNGLQPVVWIGHRRVGASELKNRPELCPVCIEPGSVLGNTTRILVSPQHRFLLRHNLLGDMFHMREAFLRAKLLPAVAGSKAKRFRPTGSVTYIHLLTHRHQVIFAEGVATETFFPGRQGWTQLHREARAEIMALFPQMSPDHPEPFRLARYDVRRKDLPYLGYAS